MPGDVVRLDGLKDRSSDEFVFWGAGQSKKKIWTKIFGIKMAQLYLDFFVFFIFFVDSTMGFT